MSTANLLTTGTAAGGQGSMIAMLLPMVLIFVVFYFILIRPQKKKDQEAAKMRSNLEVGDEVITIGGLIGTVVSLKDETVLLETGSDRSKVRFLRSAIQANSTANERVAVQRNAEREAQQAAKDAKKNK